MQDQLLKKGRLRSRDQRLQTTLYLLLFGVLMTTLQGGPCPPQLAAQRVPPLRITALTPAADPE